MTVVFVCSDDLCPENLVLWSHWKKLKIQHPRLKVTFFCPGKFHNKSENDLVKSTFFWKWYKENKSWVEIAAHGVCHTNPPEFTKFEHQQRLIIKKMTAKLRRYLLKNKAWGFKAPFYRMNKITINLIKEAGYLYIVFYDSIIFFREMRPPEFSYRIIASHTNIADKGEHFGYANKDNINLISSSLHTQLKKWENLGITYMTIGEYVEKYSGRA